MVEEIDPTPDIFYQTIILTALDEYDLYDLRIRAFNQEGTGPDSITFQGMTAEDGE